jgi:hypothetical protein
MLNQVCVAGYRTENDGEGLLARILMHWLQSRMTVNGWLWLMRFVVIYWYSFVFDSAPIEGTGTRRPHPRRTPRTIIIGKLLGGHAT